MISSNVLRVLRVLAPCAATATLGGCSTVPIAPPLAQQPYAPENPPQTAPQSNALNSRRYPSNDAALRSLMLGAYLVNQRDGGGSFNVAIAGKQFNGESNRTGGSMLSIGAVDSLYFGS